jgi:hypothetical protein
MIVNVHSFFSCIPSEFFQELASQAISSQMRGEPVSTAMRRKVIFDSFALRVIQTNSCSMFCHGTVNTMPFKPIATFSDKQCFAVS